MLKYLVLIIKFFTRLFTTTNQAATTKPQRRRRCKMRDLRFKRFEFTPLLSSNRKHNVIIWDHTYAKAAHRAMYKQCHV